MHTSQNKKFAILPTFDIKVIVDTHLQLYLLLISTILTNFTFFADVFFFFNSRVRPYMHACLPACLCWSHYHSPACPHKVPKGCSLQTPISAEEEEVPSINTHHFELVQTDNTKCLNNPRVFPGKPLSSWCSKILGFILQTSIILKSLFWGFQIQFKQKDDCEGDYLKRLLGWKAWDKVCT